MTRPLLELQKVSRYFQNGENIVKALDDVSLSIRAGEFIAIMGQSGSGKSTLMNIIGCPDRPTAGTYRIGDADVAKLSPDALAALRCKTFGFIFQRYNLLATANAEENVEIPAVYAGFPHSTRRQRAREMLSRLGILDRSGHLPSELSGGQQLRVAIARALMNDPLVILADEPTGALDSRSGKEVMDLLHQLNREGRTIILITHDAEIAKNANRVVRIQDGRIIEDSGSSAASAPVSAPAKQEAAHTLTARAAEAVKTALRALRVNIFRTALTLLGIIIGVAAVITMLAIGTGSKQKVLDQITAMGTNLLNIRPGAAGIRASGDIATLTIDDARAIEELENVDVVVPQRSGRKTLRFGNTDYATSVQAVGASFPLARDWPMAQGTFFTIQDVESYAPVIVLGATVAHILFPEGDGVGQYILAGNTPFEVIGVMKEKGAAPWGGDQDDVAYVPYTTGLIRLFGASYLNGITVKVASAERIDETEERITALLKNRHNAEDFSVRNTASFLEAATETQNTLTVLLGAVAAISLLVGGIGVMNIMLVSVTERTREIGIRMATGARRGDIMLQFNTEAAVVCTIGGIFGVLLGLGAGSLLSFFGVDVIFSPAPALLAFGCAVATGLLFGYLPARKASRLDPVVALSAE